MTLLLVAIAICLINVVAGRAYSRHLDRLEAEADPVRQYLDGSPLTVKQIEISNRIDSEDQQRTSAGRSDAQVTENFRAA